MKKLFNHRIIAAFMAAVLSFSLFCVPAAASGFADTDSVAQWDAKFDNVQALRSVALLKAFCLINGLSVDMSSKEVTWAMFNTAVSRTGEVSLDQLNDICIVYNGYFNRPVKQSLFAFKDYVSNLSSQVVASLLGLPGINFAVEQHPGSGLFRIREKSTGLWVVNSSGLYPYCEGGKLAPTCGGNKWIGERSCSTAKTNMKNLDTLNLLCNKIKESGTPAQIKPLGTNYKAIWWNRQYYCDPEGRPFVCYASEGQAAINQPRPDTSVTNEDGEPAKDETGTVINNPDNSTNIDLSGMTITLPNGDVQVADAVIYDESTKTYYIDSHDTTNNYVTYNYSWTYNINYTSITYIGQTEQYDKYYKVYYELPDGRDSADLTAEDLEQLNFDVDVVNYGRYSDNASLRSLYHFDGDTKDSSYWNYKTNFTWNTGASLTYMDAGVFNGALYLDETAHDFIMTMPTALGTEDFWLSFRYYQSATAAPQKDSYVSIGGFKALWLDGRYIYDSNSTQMAQTPTGSWNEISIVRKNSVLFYYLNGVYIGFVSLSSLLSGAIEFNFGNQQQTYKYLDEFRVLNVASFYGQTNYTCSSVPYDSNLTLVLPDERITPVADEYWAWNNSPDALFTFDCCQNSLNFFTYAASGSWTVPSNYFMVNRQFSPSLSGVALSGSTSLYFDPCRFTSFLDGKHETIYPLSLVFYYRNGSAVESCVVNVQIRGDGKVYCYPSVVSGYALQTNFAENIGYMYVITQRDILLERIEVLPSGGKLSTYEKHTSVTGIGGSLPSLKVPTLAVKTDIDVTGQKIGGVRPSVPAKGLVWAMVENGVISSIQIYDGSAWVACDGRIFTGTRWVPYGSYNIVTLKDFYDVADASGSDFSYIYTETSFWNWWQKSWNAFTTKLFAALGSAGFDVSGGTNPDGTSKSLWDRIKNAFNDTLGALIETLFALIEDVLKALLSLVTDMLSFFFGFLTDTVLGAVKAFFGAFKDNSLFDFFQQPPVIGSDGTETDGGYGLPNEVGTAFTFISGVIMVLPPDIRSILFFGLGIMVLLGVFKLVKA